MAAKQNKQAKGKTETEATPPAIGKSDIKRSALEAWRKLDAVIQKELDDIQAGAKEVNASTVTAATARWTKRRPLVKTKIPAHWPGLSSFASRAVTLPLQPSASVAHQPSGPPPRQDQAGQTGAAIGEPPR